MQLIKTMLIAAFITGFGVATAAPNEDMSFSMMDFPDLPVSKSHRIEAANQIQQECSRILALIPRLSPTEDEWLEGEMKAKRDLENLMRRPEYARHALYVHFYDCVVQSRLAAKLLTDRERSVAWARLASRFTLTTPSDLEYLADRVGNPELQGSVKRFAAWEFLTTYRIIDEIVIPYLIHSKE